jgi:hypothetical protein
MRHEKNVRTNALDFRLVEQSRAFRLLPEPDKINENLRPL